MKVGNQRLTAVALHVVLALLDRLVEALVLLLGHGVHADFVLHRLANVAARAHGVGLVVGEIVVCEHQTQTKAACE